MKSTSSFLPYFNLEKCHYIIPPVNSCNPFQLLPSTTTLGVGEMLELVVTGGFNFISTGISPASWNGVVTPFYSNLRFKGVEITTFISFSIRRNLPVFKRFSPQSLQLLNFLPSVFYKCEGRR